jgi:hypothetical protein
MAIVDSGKTIRMVHILHQKTKVGSTTGRMKIEGAKMKAGPVTTFPAPIEFQISLKEVAHEVLTAGNGDRVQISNITKQDQALFYNCGNREHRLQLVGLSQIDNATEKRTHGNAL